MIDQAIADLSARPAWVADAVFYQIFPDRFARSDRVPKPSNLLSWHSPPSAQGYHGGDLLGVCEHLDHLVNLGVNAIYLNPIFQSACNHRYHTHDYRLVDPLLGGNSAFRELVDETHARNIRIMLDGVFNHASRGFFQFMIFWRMDHTRRGSTGSRFKTGRSPPTTGTARQTTVAGRTTGLCRNSTRTIPK